MAITISVPGNCRRCGALWADTFGVTVCPKHGDGEHDWTTDAEAKAGNPYPGMNNQAMRRKLISGAALDVSKSERTPEGCYILPADFFREGFDYCDADAESWIWSIGREERTGQDFASTTTRYYGMAGYRCLWLR